MPSGLDAALKSLEKSGNFVNENVTKKYDVKVKKEIAEATVDLEAEGLEGCMERVRAMEKRIAQFQWKIGELPPTKGNKPKIAELKKEMQELQDDGNYRGALKIVRAQEEKERERKRGERDRAEELEMMGGGLQKKGAAPAGGLSAAAKAAAKTGSSRIEKAKAEKAAADAAMGAFDLDAEVVAVINSAIEGSGEACEKLKAGCGTITYKFEVKEEVASMAKATIDRMNAGLKRISLRDSALVTVRALLWNPPAYLSVLPTVLGLLEEATLKSEPGKNAKDLLSKMLLGGPTGKVMPDLCLPPMLDMMGAGAAGKYKVKIGVISLLKDFLKRMGEDDICPIQLGLMMPQVTSALRTAVGDARKEVKKAAEDLLNHIAREMVISPEVKEQAEGLVASVIDSANMERAAEVLTKLGNTTFMNTVDAASFALLFPIVTRAMREASLDAKKKGVQVTGASVNLISSPEFLTPYLPELLPLLQDCLMHAAADVEREAAKTFGLIAAGLPRVCDEDIMPYLLQQLQCGGANVDVAEVDRRGAAHGLSEVLIRRRDLYSPTLYNTILPRISSGKTDEEKAGALALFQFLPHSDPLGFLPHLTKVLPVVLRALNEDSEVITKQAKASVEVIVQEYGATYPRLLLPFMQDAVFFDTEAAQELAIDLFFLLCDKIQDAVKFGQDFTSVEALSVVQRRSLLSSIYIARTDPNPAIRRVATLLWKERVQSGPKAKADILSSLQQYLKGLKESDKPRRVAAAVACIKDLKGSGDIQDETLKDVEALPFVSEKALELPDVQTVDPVPPPPSRIELLRKRCADILPDIYMAAPLRQYIETVVLSCCIESHDQAQAIELAEAELKPITPPKASSAMEHFKLKDVYPQIFDGVPDRKAAQVADVRPEGDCLVRVENLMLMYGGGHTLLKDTTLELLKGHRYGVVGRNGAGKTTLMSTLASGRVKQIPKWLKTLHVKPEVLVEASDLTAVQFCRRHNPEESGSTEDSMQRALNEVGFPQAMQDKNVGELSGGWRMKLLIASAMMRECDLLLLDEPTNHLDVASVKWLCEYLKSLTRSTVMVISHDPNFLNEVCTDIIQYSNTRTLEYFSGNFEDFRKDRNITNDEEAEALLLGQDTEDFNFQPDARATPGQDGAEDDEDDSLGLKAGMLDKAAKISFPIPGKLQGHSTGKPVLELQSVYFTYEDEGENYTLKQVTCKVPLTGRIGIIGVNGAGKSTLLGLLCGELMPSLGPGGAKPGEVYKHRNLRMAYIAQDHMFHLEEFMLSSPYVYNQRRYQNGYDEMLQKRLCEPQNEDQRKQRIELAKQYGKYGREVGRVCGRRMQGNEILYEVEWKDLEDPKQNTHEPIAKFKKLDAVGFARAYDERKAAENAGTDTRPLSSKEIVKHYEQFGLDEELVMNRNIGTFSAGQRSKLTLGAAFWTKPHLVALDEPTNYIDMETLDSLAKGLNRFKGAVLVISHSSEFVDRVCDETWTVADGSVTRKAPEKGKK